MGVGLAQGLGFRETWMSAQSSAGAGQGTGGDEVSQHLKPHPELRVWPGVGVQSWETEQS